MANRRKSTGSSNKTSEASFEFPNTDEQAKYDKELTWCIKKLENGILSEKDKKRADDASKFLKTLRSNTVSVIRKRQIMHNLFGDYRATIQREEKQTKSTNVMINKNKSESLDMMLKSRFLRKSGKVLKDKIDLQEKEQENQDDCNQVDEAKECIVEKNIFKMATGNEPFKFNFKNETE